MASFTLEEIEKAAAARLIRRGNNPFVDGVSTDTRTIRAGELFIALTGENFNGHAFVKKAVEAGAAAVMISDASYGDGLDPKVTVFLVKDTKKGLEDVAHFHRMRFHVPVIGVTGSNGKTTTKDMITAILSTRFHVTATQKNFNNEIGLSMTLLSMTGDTEVCVVEMGMRGFGQIKELCHIASPTMGVVTNVGTSHIGILGSQDNIAKAKKELIDALPADGTAILNGDDERVCAMGKGFAGRVIRYGLNGRYTVRGSDVRYEEEDTRYTCTCFDEAFKVKLHLLGVHNVYDAMAATAACRVLGVDTGKSSGPSAISALPDSGRLWKPLTALPCWMIPIMPTPFPWRWPSVLRNRWQENTISLCWEIWANWAALRKSSIMKQALRQRKSDLTALSP